MQLVVVKVGERWMGSVPLYVLTADPAKRQYFVDAEAADNAVEEARVKGIEIDEYSVEAP